MVGEIGHFPEILILLVIAMLVFGPGKLPELGSALGRGIREFKDATNGLNSTLQAPAAPPYQQQPVIGQNPPVQAVQQPPQWDTAAPQPQPVTMENVSGER